MVYEPDLVGTTRPSPRVRITFSSLNPATTQVTVFRRGGRVGVVRDAERAFGAGGFTVVDYEVPEGIYVHYWAEMFNSAGTSLGVTGSSSVILYGEQGFGWFSDPLVPDNVVEVALDAQFGESLAQGRELQLHRVGETTIALMGSLGLLQGVNLTCETTSIEQADKLRDVLAGGIVLVRTTPRIRIPNLLYVAVGQFAELGQDIQYGGERIVWPLQGDEVTPTTVSTAVSSAPYAVYMAAFTTYAEAKIAYATYLDAKKNPPGV